MDVHVQQLQRFCRLCAGKRQEDLERTYVKSRVSFIIKDALGIQVEEDDETLHPKYLCGSCYRKLTRWKDAKRVHRKKGVPINIRVHQFLPHDVDCETCEKTPLERSIEEIVTCTSTRYANLSVHTRQERILVVELDEEGDSRKVLTIKANRTWSIRVYGKLVPTNDNFSKVGDHVDNNDVEFLMQTLAEISVCPGNVEYANLADNQLLSRPVYKHVYGDSSTIRHASCTLLTTTNRCGPCAIYRSSLAAAVKKVDTGASSKFTPYQHLPREELEERLRSAQVSFKTMKKRVETLELRIDSMLKKEGEELHVDQSAIFTDILSASTTEEFFDTLAPDSPQKILWEQQKKAATTKRHGMRWHPAILRMCIALHAKSASAYDLIRKSGFLQLPHANSLRHYTHFSDYAPGLNTELLAHIVKEQNLNEQPDFKRNVCVTMDEMKVKSGLVFSTSGRLVGFCDVGDINNELKKFEEHFQEESTKLASHVFVIMVRGLFSSLKAPFAYYPCESMTRDQLYSCVWDSVKMLEAYGLRVRCITSDGASTNRKFYEICGQDGGTSHWTWNPYAKHRKVYFMSDPPHLLKTIRNNFANSGAHQKTRNLMFQGKQISWHHILKVYDWDIASDSGLRKLYKISPDHLHLTPSSKMRVSLAAQVLSSTMANALQSQNLAETESTRHFIRMTDLFFDSLNVSTRTGGRKARKPALEPYTSIDDWRFTFLDEDFLSFLDEWESEGKLVPGLSKTERSNLCLSKPTMDGLRMTVKSFTAVARELLAESGVQYLLSEKFSQDPLEEHFGKQRGMGGRHENPDARQFGNNMGVLQVAGSCISSSLRANVQRQSKKSPLKVHPLPKRMKKK